MSFITADTFAKNCIFTIRQLKKRGEKSVLWIRIKDLAKKLDINFFFDSFDKEIKGKFKDNCPTKQQIKKYKRHGSKLKISNDIKDKDVKFVYAYEDVVIPIIMTSRSLKAIKFRSKLGFNHYDITLKNDHQC